MAYISDVYAPFAAAMRQDGFGDLVDPSAWPAELVAAHVILVLDEATTALRMVAAGGAAEYDDAAASDKAGLRNYLVSTGSLQELAAQVERAAAALDVAYDALGASARMTVIDARLHHRDTFETRQLTIDELVADLAGAHAERHLSELADICEVVTN